jgi:hypothetical protein
VLFHVVESTCNPLTVTAEAAGSSPVVPAISFQGVTGCDTENSNPQLNPQLSVNRLVHPHRGQEFALRGPCFIAVFLRVQIERRLNLRMTQDSLHAWSRQVRPIR